MEKFNLNNRILMFAVCSSIEFDLRNFISTNKPVIPLTSELIEKAKSRKKDDYSFENSNSDNFALLVELDLGDLYSFIMSNNISFKVNVQRKVKLQKIFEVLIPIRNRVMHTRPLEFADRSILEATLLSIDKELPTIDWKETKQTRKLIIESPQTILIEQQISLKDDSTNLLHNLPLPEFDDTGFVGRRNEIKEITELILNHKSQIITIVGNGGIGKTATAIKCLYDIIDNPETQNRFDAMIWVSLKTRSLTSGEFLNIRNAIHSIDSMYSFLQENMIKDSDSPEQDILSFMNEFKTLLIIDNLESITTEEIMHFLKEVPDKSKVLITSRNGLGELENRYKLKEMNSDDSKTYFRLLSQYYGLELFRREKKELTSLIVDDLYSSPLSIKWFITSIFFGTDESSLIANKKDLISFSMSNIIDKLSSNQKDILSLFLLQGRPLVFGEIDFYIDNNTEDIVSDISVLLSTSMLELKGANYQINSMAKDYLSIHNPPNNAMTLLISKKRSDLNNILQDIKLKKEASPFLPQSLFGNMDSNNKKISSYYLIQALENSEKENWSEAYALIERAREIAPDYFEVYKIKAFINAENMNLYEAINSYRTAIENAENGFQKATVYYLFSIFYKLKMNDYEEANKLIDEAIKNFPDSKEILLEKSRVLVYLAQYDEAEKVLLTIQPSVDDTDKYKNQFASRYADLSIRKGQQYDRRDSEKQLDLVLKACSIIENLQEIDRGTSSILIKALNDLAFFASDDKIRILLEEKISKHFPIMVNNTNNIVKKLRNAILSRENLYNPSIIDLVKRLGKNYTQEAKEINNPLQGYIVNLKPTFGFVANSTHSYYFKTANLQYTNALIGDKVEFDIIDTSKYKNAINIKKIFDFN